MKRRVIAFISVLVFVGLLFMFLPVEAKPPQPPEPTTYTLTLSRSGELASDAHILINGDFVADGVYTFAKGTVVTVNLYKDAEIFDHWVLDKKVHTDHLLTITMDTDHNLVGVFAQQYITVSIKSTRGGYTSPKGVITYLMWDIDYPYNYELTVTAYPRKNCVFSYWIWDGTIIYADRTITVTIISVSRADHTLQAVFA